MESDKTVASEVEKPVALGPMAIQHYRSLDELVRHGKLILPKPRQGWRLVKDPLSGHINGLEDFAGRTVATNGIMVLLEDELGNFCYGHLQWFIPNRDEKDVELSDLWDEMLVPKAKKPKKDIKQYLERILDNL